MKLKIVFVGVFLGTIFFLSGCNYPEPTIVCPAADLVEPKLKSPYNYAKLTDTTPTLTWSFKAVTYPYPEPFPTPSPEYFCHPAKFRISLSTAPYFTDKMGNETIGGIEGAWTTPVLQPGKTYRWSVLGISQGIEGPSSVENYFSIGEYCVASGLAAPVLLEPPNGSTVDTLTPKVMFDTTMNCLPDGYLVEYSQDPSFASKGTYGGGGYYGYGMTLPELENCATYYWRVTAWKGSYSTVGPYSSTWSFETDTEDTLCLDIEPIPSVEIPQEIVTQPPDPSDFIWEVILNANCRAGPGTAYNETGFAPQGYLAKIEGRDEDGNWFRLFDPNGISCWVSRIALKVPEGWPVLKVLDYPLPPPATETAVPPYACSQHTDMKSCITKSTCIWDRSQSVCKNR